MVRPGSPSYSITWLRLNPVFIRNVLSRTVFYKALPITQDKFSLLTLILDNKAV